MNDRHITQLLVLWMVKTWMVELSQALNDDYEVSSCLFVVVKPVMLHFSL